MPFNQPLSGLIEPAGPRWAKASTAERKAFYEHAGVLAVKAKRAELARAIGSNGRRMKARKRPRPDGANGPVLTPHDATSRTSRLMDARATAGGVTLFWHSGHGGKQRKSWGTILGYHAAGKVRGAPVRDVRLSKRGISQLKADLAIWWAQFSAPPKPKPEPPKPSRPRRNQPAPSPPPAPARPPRSRPLTLAQQAMARRHPNLKPYLLHPKDGFTGKRK